MKQVEATAATTATTTATGAAVKASATKAAPAKSNGSDATPKIDKPRTDLDTLLSMIAAQDEALKTIKLQTQEMLAQNANLRRGLRQVVKDASRNDLLETQLAQYKKKWSSLKNLVS